MALILNVLCLDGLHPGRQVHHRHARREARPIDVYTSLMKTRLAAMTWTACKTRRSWPSKKPTATNKTFMAQAAVVDKMVEEAVAVERELLGK